MEINKIKIVYSYDKSNRLISVKHDDGRGVLYSYDRTGNMISAVSGDIKLLFGKGKKCPEEDTPVINRTSSELICSVCNTAISHDAEFCRKCGHKREELPVPPPPSVSEKPVKLSCPACNASLSSDSKFCRKCGYSMEKTSPPIKSVQKEPSLPPPPSAVKISAKPLNKSNLIALLALGCGLPILLSLAIGVFFVADLVGALGEFLDSGPDYGYTSPDGVPTTFEYIPGPTSAPTTAVNIPPPATSPPAEKGPAAVLEENYEAINNKDFKKAYNFRSNEWRLNNNYQTYYEMWYPNIKIQLLETVVDYQSGDKGKIWIRLYTEDQNLNTGKTDKGYYSGYAYMVKEKGQWKISDVKVDKE